VRRIAVIGQGQLAAVGAEAELAALARELGERIALEGVLLVCGGLGGVMEEAAAGAAAGGGQVLGILPGEDPAAANPHVTIPVATGLGEARNLVIVHSAEAFIAVGGAYGTLSEIAFALKHGKPVIGLRCSFDIPGMQHAEDAATAVTLALV
jgi:uncharacterized protein (TIGR00725 family)